MDDVKSESKSENLDISNDSLIEERLIEETGNLDTGF